MCLGKPLARVAPEAGAVIGNRKVEGRVVVMESFCVRAKQAERET
jgi:hypothetical protein